MSEQAKNLKRVSTRIAASILEFCHEHDRFHADELRNHVSESVGSVAPGSADRILRDLRLKKLINYRVVSRSRSLYEVVPVDTEVNQLTLPLQP